MSKSPDSRKWYTVTEAANRFRVDSKTVRRWIAEGYFPGTEKTSPLRGHYRIPEEDIVAFEKNRKVK